MIAKPLLPSMHITDDKNSSYNLVVGSPKDVDFNGFHNALVYHIVFPSKDIPTDERVAIFEEILLEDIAVIRSVYYTQTPRIINIRSKEPALVLATVLRGDPAVAREHLEKEDMLSGYINLYYQPKNSQRLFLQPGKTEILELYFAASRLETFVEEENGDFTIFQKKILKKKAFKYLSTTMKGSPRQLFFAFYLIHTLRAEGSDLDFNDSMVNLYTEYSLKEILDPSHFDYSYLEIEELGRILLNIHRNITITNVCKKELRESFLKPARFKKAFMLIWNNTPEEYIREIKISLAQKLLDEGLNLSIIICRLGYKTATEFNLAFKEIHGVDADTYIKRLHGESW